MFWVNLSESPLLPGNTGSEPRVAFALMAARHTRGRGGECGPASAQMASMAQNQAEKNSNKCKPSILLIN